MAATLSRLLRRGSRGRDVLAVERALKKAGYWSGDRKPDRDYDSDTVRDVKRFQRERKLEVDGVVGENTFGALRPYLDAYGKWLLGRVPAAGNPKTTRQRIVAAAKVGYDGRGSIHYTQTGRRMQGVREKIQPPKHPIWEDCSSFATWCYWVAGAPDPNGNSFDGIHGYTGDQIRHGREVKTPRPGDLVFYGHSHGAINHVTVYVGNGRVISHGQESGPELYPMDYSRPGGPRQQIRTYVT